ncbi:tRNA ligase [Talaromyces stipitatus ATCC 10500]|uniref:tRNA ligase n=1 Tax=Talaromyces stipitatus (strain ATCC 10500 / CBS 375.48 / QM 6759 / NRRL 1006) TaxID=441959 RepID=B8LVJ2_TALSN|nr:tRNA ligase [Talaromyces stipitatus ATCC 10500]EED24011.1 tRNA ligase [Talaromyces stipitatus ATCC 10500]
MVEQDPHEVRQLVQTLEAASKRNRSESKKTFGCKKSTFVVAGADDIKVHSWRFMDWDYKRSDLPTYARGLFTTKLKDGRDEICIRGYDKFFNIDEVNDTRWRNVETNTRGPYELSVKENGCIIFISGLEDGTLLVCSKHSTGSRGDTPLSHAQAGEQWVERHLSKVGKTVKELALKLRQMNVTAVGELCDDRFEEHVLAYDEDAAGIYLHGLNYNLPEFTTMSGSEVHRFADEWGFKKAEFVVMDNINEVKDFLDKCTETGSWNGRDTEGFVIRCQLGNSKSGEYRDWFFKYKFEEPYLMYRQWREATKAVIAGRVPNIRKHKKITEEYLIYARRQLAKDPKIGKLYNQNHGIIAMRQGFLDERGLKGSEIIAMEREGDDVEPAAKNFVVVPVASIGCGKTTVALALAKLFDWGHVQNDNLGQQKNKAKKFALMVTNSLAAHAAVIADRNNHQKRERKQIIDDVTEIVPDAKFIALHYVHEPKGLLLDDIRRVTRERVLTRGDNHQTIRAGSKDTGEIIGIMEGFLQRFEAIDTDREPDMYFHEVIDLDVADSSRENLEKIVNRLHSVYPNLVKRVPDSAELDAAIASALEDYHVQTDLSWGNSKKAEKKMEKAAKKNDNHASAAATQNKSQDPIVAVKNLEYFGILVPSSDIQQLLTTIFNDNTNGSAERNKLYHHLKNSRRIQPSFHVTLIHRAHSKEQPQIWEQYTDLYISRMNERVSQCLPINPPTKLADARVRVERLVWNDAIMAFVVRILASDEKNTTNGQEKLPSSWPCVNTVPHITVGTANPEVKPKQSNDLLQKWLQVGSGGDTGIWEVEVPGVKVLEGSVLPVMMRGK